MRTKKTSIPFPFKLNGIWSWWQFSFRFYDPNGNSFGSKSKGKLSPRSYPIQYERKWKHSFLSVCCSFSTHQNLFPVRYEFKQTMALYILRRDLQDWESFREFSVWIEKKNTELYCIRIIYYDLFSILFNNWKFQISLHLSSISIYI